MSRVDSRIATEIRPYRESDESRVLELLSAAMGGGPIGARSSTFFRWKHMASPFGTSVMLIAETEGQIVGFRALMRWQFVTSDGTIQAVRPVDTATHPDFQGQGVFSRLTRAALSSIREEVDLVFNTPNSKSLPGYLKMGWKVVGSVPISVRIRRPVRFALGVRGRDEDAVAPESRPTVEAETAAAVLETDGLLDLLAATNVRDHRMRTRRDLEYLRWRYASAPGLDYRGVVLEEGGFVRGLALFRVRPRGRLWESTVDELIVTPGDRRAARRLLRRVARAGNVDHLTCHFPKGSTAAKAAVSAGFLRSPEGMTFVVNPLRDGIDPDPSSLSSWALSIGDLEVF